MIAAPWICIPSRLFAVGLFILPVVSNGVRAAPMEPPSCSTTEVVEFVQDAFDLIQAHQTKSGMKLARIDQIRDLGVVKHVGNARFAATRGCEGTGKLSNGSSVKLYYRVVTRHGRDYNVPICFPDTRYHPESNGDCGQFKKLPPSR